MRFSCDYNTLLSNLLDVASVAEHALTNDKDRNIIFKMVKNPVDGSCSMEFIAINTYIILKRKLVEGTYNLTLDEADVDSNGVKLIQLSSKELLGYLNSYKSLRRSKVEEVIFENGDRGKIKCTVIEKEWNEKMNRATQVPDETGLVYDEVVQEPVNNDEGRTYISHWAFNNIPVRPNLFGDINLTAPEGELTVIDSQAIALVTSSLLSVMKSEADMFSHLMFDENNIIAPNQAFTTVMRNFLNENHIFEGIRLNHTCINYLSKLITGIDAIEVARLERRLYVKTENSESFLLYDTQLSNYQNAINMFVKGHYIAVNRIYLKDVLKRLNLVNDAIEFHVNVPENKITLSNTKFSQDIDITTSAGMEGYSILRFKIMPDILNKAIIGNDNSFTNFEEEDLEQLGEKGQFIEDTFIYVCPNEKTPTNPGLVFSDVLDNWYSVARVKTY